MLLQLFIPTPNPMLRASTQKSLNKRFAALWAISRILYTRINHLLINRKRVFRVLAKGQFTAEQFVCNDSHAPQINRETVSFSSDNFWCNIMWSSDNSAGSKPPLYFKSFGSAHIDQCEITVSIHHQILWFEVSVNNSVRVHVLHHQKHLSHEKASVFNGE